MAALAFRRRAKRHDAADARIQTLGDAFDDAAFASCVTAFENDGDLETMQPNPFLQLDEFKLQMSKLVDVCIILPRFARLWPPRGVPILLDGSDFLSVTPHGFLRRGKFAILNHRPPKLARR